MKCFAWIRLVSSQPNKYPIDLPQTLCTHIHLDWLATMLFRGKILHSPVDISLVLEMEDEMLNYFSFLFMRKLIYSLKIELFTFIRKFCEFKLFNKIGQKPIWQRNRNYCKQKYQRTKICHFFSSMITMHHADWCELSNHHE